MPLDGDALLSSLVGFLEARRRRRLLVDQHQELAVRVGSHACVVAAKDHEPFDVELATSDHIAAATLCVRASTRTSSRMPPGTYGSCPRSRTRPAELAFVLRRNEPPQPTERGRQTPPTVVQRTVLAPGVSNQKLSTCSPPLLSYM